MEFRIPIAQIKALNDRLESLHTLTRTEAAEVGARAVSAMKDLISGGQSPIQGKGRFPAYKNPEKYPGKKKPHSPVNLRLTGEMLDSLGFVVLPEPGGKGFSVSIGYNSVQSTLKESGHREGVNGQPKRPTIPDATRGERFASSVLDAMRKVVLDAIRKR